MFTSRRALLRTIERMQHDHAAQIGRLVDTIAVLSGHPAPPPVRAIDPETERLERERRDRRRQLVAHPERLPD